jgi:hypothetical protein
MSINPRGRARSSIRNYFFFFAAFFLVPFFFAAFFFAATEDHLLITICGDGANVA